MPSPKPRPVVLKLIEGRGNGRDSGGRPVKATPGFVRLPPAAPTWLPREAAAEWRRVVPELQRLQLLKPVDRAALTAYCLTWARLVEAQQILKKESLLLTDPFGKQYKHPALLVVEAAGKELRAWCGEFGLTPSSESGVAKPEAGDDGDDDPFAG